MKSIIDDPPPNGVKIVALFYDGSGAKLLLIDDNGDIYSAEGEYESKEYMDSFSHWIEIPDDYKFWMETAGDRT